MCRSSACCPLVSLHVQMAQISAWQDHLMILVYFSTHSGFCCSTFLLLRTVLQKFLVDYAVEDTISLLACPCCRFLLITFVRESSRAGCNTVQRL